MDSDYILKVEPTELEDGLGVWYERKTAHKDDTKDLALAVKAKWGKCGPKEALLGPGAQDAVCRWCFVEMYIHLKPVQFCEPMSSQ